MRLVSVVVPLWLTATIKRVAHVEPQVEAAQLGGGDRVDVELAVAQRVEHRGHAATGDRRRALADDAHLARCSPDASRCGDRRRQRPRRRRTARSIPSRSTILPRSVLRKLLRRLADLLQQEVRRVAAVDVARGDLRGGDLVVGRPAAACRRRRAAACRRARRPRDRRARTTWPRLAARRPSRRLAVDADVAAPSPRPRRTARWRR